MRLCIGLLAVCLSAVAADAPAGYPSRVADLDVLPGFRNPPPGYGEVAFYWWVGDPLTKERLTWQLDQLRDRGVTALQVNYPHTDKGGRSWGLTMASDPPLFSPKWWELFSWFLKEARARGMAVSLSDYTLGWAGNGWYMDEILRDHPDMHGAELDRMVVECSGDCAWRSPPNTLSTTAYRIDNGRIAAGSAVGLRGKARWNAPAGTWRIVAVFAKDVPVSLDPMHPLSGKQMIEKFFQRFEDRNPGESGKGLNFFFSDELTFGVRGWLWNRYFAGEFQKRKGYDVIPELASLFEDTGPRAVKVRLDYSDVLVALSEENYFRPLYEWHHSRGMLYGCDHGGRGRDVTEFGDYFRTQRWMTGPGNDQPGLASDVIKNKVSSSITHLYERERTWLEGYYGSGWGTTSRDLVDATWRNFAQGQNLLTLHGLYYSTHGGWWEWAPPCNHFRMPYWAHMPEFLHAVERMSYLLSQGHHRADVAIVYPVAAMEAGLSGKEAVDTAFALGAYLYEHGIDFDFIDFESLARARVSDGKLEVAGEEYRALVLPAMRAVRHSTLEKAVELQRAGGVSIVLGAAAQASERTGDGDPEVLAMARELSPSAVRSNADVAAKITGRDFACKAEAQPSVLHRKVGTRDIYMVYGTARNTECTFRAGGRVELWDPWSGSTSELPVAARSNGTTTLRMPLESTEAQLIVFAPGEARTASSQSSAEPVVIPLNGKWRFELKPTLDNRFGDYRLPASNTMLGAEAREFLYREEGGSSEWRRVACTYGPHFWKLGPVQRDRALESAVSIDHPWVPYEYSLRWGIENDPGHQGYHGLKDEVPNDFIGLGKLEIKPTTTEYVEEEKGASYYLRASVVAPRDLRARVLSGGELRPAAVWLNGESFDPGASTAPLKQGSNELLMRYDGPGRGYFVFLDPTSPAGWKQTYPLASEWYERPGLLPFDTRPQNAQPAGVYRTTSPPGLRGMRIVSRGSVSLRVNGMAVPLGAPGVRTDGAREYRVVLRPGLVAPAEVDIRIEQERGLYGGEALPEPVQFECGPGEIELGDWSSMDGLRDYSGGAWYRREIDLSADQIGGDVQLDLGRVSSSAEVWVNGVKAGVRLAPPFRVSVGKLLKAGSNRIEVLVYSALDNHYRTIPTRYRRPGVSGLIGPVRLLVSRAENGH